MFNTGAGERITLLALISAVFVVCFLAFIFALPQGKQMTIIGVPNGTAPSSSAIVREYEDARGANRDIYREGPAARKRNESPLPEAGISF